MWLHMERFVSHILVYFKFGMNVNVRTHERNKVEMTVRTPRAIFIFRNTPVLNFLELQITLSNFLQRNTVTMANQFPSKTVQLRSCYWVLWRVMHLWHVVHCIFLQEYKLQAVRYLPDIVVLQRLLMDRFHRRIDRTKADQMKIRDFLYQLPSGLPPLSKYWLFLFLLLFDRERQTQLENSLPLLTFLF